MSAAMEPCLAQEQIEAAEELEGNLSTSPSGASKNARQFRRKNLKFELFSHPY
jgi:hypothetical protein